jgi:hypothetical protein
MALGFNITVSTSKARSESMPFSSMMVSNALRTQYVADAKDNI